jgi:hypothetical protein
MRIFCAVRHSNDPKQFYGGLWSGNFYPGLRQNGCEIVESQTDLLPASRFMHVAGDFTPEELQIRAQVTEKILEEVRAAHRQKPIDLFLGYFYNSHFDPAAFQEIQRIGIPTVNYFCNSMYQFELVADISRHVNFAWHTERAARPLYEKVGAHPVWVQMGADPDLNRPMDGSKRLPRACFVGQRYADRDRHLAALVQRGVPVDIYGPGWGADSDSAAADSFITQEASLGRPSVRSASLQGYGQVVARNFRGQGLVGGLKRTLRQMAYRRETQRLKEILLPAVRAGKSDPPAVFSRYEVVLNCSNVWADGRPGSELIPHVRLRDFEAPMCRACYLTGYVDELEDFYELGKEIEAYRSVQELIEKTRFYLANPDAAEKLRAAGFERARRDHTWKRRFQLLFQKIGID